MTWCDVRKLQFDTVTHKLVMMNEIHLPRCRLTFNSDWVMDSAEESMSNSCDDGSSSISSGFIQTDGSLMIKPSDRKVVFRKTIVVGIEPTSDSSCDRSFTLRLNFYAMNTSLSHFSVVSNAKFIELYRLNNQELSYVQTLRGVLLEAEDNSSSSGVLFQHSCKDHFGIDEFHLKFLSIKVASVELSLTLSNFELLFEEKATTRNDYRASTSYDFNVHADNTAITMRGEGSDPSSESVATPVVQSAGKQQQQYVEDTRTPSVEEADRGSATIGNQPINGSDRQLDQRSDPIEAIGRNGKSDESHSHSHRREAYGSSFSAPQQQHLDPNQLAAILWTVKSTLINEIAELLDAKLQPIVSKLSIMEAQMAASEAKHRIPH